MVKIVIQWGKGGKWTTDGWTTKFDDILFMEWIFRNFDIQTDNSYGFKS